MTAAAALLSGAAAQEQAPRRDDRPSAVGTAVAAVVNDSPISTFDVQQRLRLMAVSSGAQLPDEALAQMQQQALRELIEERLKLSEAGQFEQLVISEEEIDEELARIAAAGGGSPEQLTRDLAAQGIAIETLRDRIRADLAWDRLVSGRYRSRINITDQEVEDELNRLRAQAGQEQYLLAEICLPVESAAQADQMREVGMQMIGQMQQGVPFRALAQQYSGCPSAARGGDLGWVSMNDVREGLRPVLPQLSPGNVSLPVLADGMVVMLALRQKRDAAEQGEPAFEIAYAGVPRSAGLDAAERVQARLRETNACESNALSVDLGPNAYVSALPMLPAAAFEPAFRPALATLERGEVSDVMVGEDAYHVAMLCRKDDGLGLPSRTQIRNQLTAEALERQSRRYLRDIERDSAVDVRLADG